MERFNHFIIFYLIRHRKMGHHSLTTMEPGNPRKTWMQEATWRKIKRNDRPGVTSILRSSFRSQFKIPYHILAFNIMSFHIIGRSEEELDLYCWGKERKGKERAPLTILKISYKKYILTLNINVNAEALLQYRMYTFYYLYFLFCSVIFLVYFVNYNVL